MTDVDGLDAAGYYGSGIALALFGGVFSVGWAGFSSEMAASAEVGSTAAAFWGGMGAVALGAGIGVGIAIAGLVLFQNVQ